MSKYRNERIAATLLVLVPAGYLIWQIFGNHLGPDPAKSLVDQLGLWALRWLLVTLCMTPLRWLTGFSGWIPLRRHFGLAAFAYACIHLLAYFFLLFEARWSAVQNEIGHRPYVVVGLLCWLSLLPLAVTSTQSWQRRLGRRWLQLHRLIYAAMFLALIHFIWVKKLGVVAVWPYVLLGLMLMLARVFHHFAKKRLKFGKNR